MKSYIAGRVNKLSLVLSTLVILLSGTSCEDVKPRSREVIDFNDSWYFALGDTIQAGDSLIELDLPHDWSIEGDFDPNNPAGVGGGALPGGTGWYVKGFTIDSSCLGKKIFIQFDGVYQNSTVWVNGRFVGNRPNGYISFEYDISPFISYGAANRMVVKVDNSLQPNSRWYSGSGIYRDVRLVIKNPVHIPRYGVYVTTETTGESSTRVRIQTTLKNESSADKSVLLVNTILDPAGESIGESTVKVELSKGETIEILDSIEIQRPMRWSLDSPNLYLLESQVKVDGQQKDHTTTTFGIRDFSFDSETGFTLNGGPTKIKGVCLHHDLGCLGAAFNVRAMERQLEIMKGMGVNAVRTSHNPPAPQLLDLCDRMGLLVMDEMFDMWKLQKTKYDYGKYWDEWHIQDLKDFIRRDRNHPSVIIWSVGNEIIEQYNHADSSGGLIARKLVSIVKSLDSRPVTTANNDTSPENPLLRFGNLDLVGFNYHHEEYELVPDKFSGRPFIATETNSELSTRGHYDMPSDSQRIWPHRWDGPFLDGNPDHTVSAYDHVRPPWGSTHEDTWRIVKKHDFISGMFIWTGFDYLGEPTPYGWPSRSSYFGVVDLAGFPKDTYYLYKSEWTEDTVLHVFPHWTWTEGKEVDIWAYYNYADEVELFLNNRSLGRKRKGPDAFHVMWRVPFEAGVLRAVSYKKGKAVKTTEIRTAGPAYQLKLTADRSKIGSDNDDLSFITVEVLDEKGVLVPGSDNQLFFEINGPGKIVAVDNGNPVSHESFTKPTRKAFNGKALVIIKGNKRPGDVVLKAVSGDLKSDSLSVTTQ